MDELDSIAEDLGVQLEERRVSEPAMDPIQRVLSKVSTSLTRKSTRLRNKSVNSVAGELPKMIDQELDERRLSRVLSRVPTVPRSYQDIREFPPGEIQDWLEVAHAELPAAIDSITSVLETLPSLEYGSPIEEKDVQDYEPQYHEEPQYYEEPQHYDEPQYYEAPQYYDEPQYYEEPQESGYHDEELAESPPQRSYTEPLFELHDRIAELERRLQNETISAESPQHSEREFITPTERATSESVAFEPPIQRNVDEEQDAEPVPPIVERIATRRATMSPEVSTQQTFSPDL
jgi:hypothetical protein